MSDSATGTGHMRASIPSFLRILGKCPVNTTSPCCNDAACYDAGTRACAADATLAASYQALCPTLLAAAATLHALCMPGPLDCFNRSHPLAIMAHLWRHMRSLKYVAAERWAASLAVMGSSKVATNAHIAGKVRGALTDLAAAALRPQKGTECCWYAPF